jgi:ADP-heptose:LPS heptosyltransferase
MTGAPGRRLGDALAWRRREARIRLYRALAARGGRFFVAARWPWPLRKPWQRHRLRLSAPGGGIGDELMCGPVFAEIKRRNPGCEITFVTRYPELFEGMPGVDRVERWVKRADEPGIQLMYEHAVPPGRTLIELMGECVGLEMKATRLVPPPVRVSEAFEAMVRAIPSPVVALQVEASAWTPNKDWMPERWQEVARRLARDCTVIEVGGRPTLDGAALGPRFRSFAGRTSVPEYARLIQAATVFAGPISSGMHLANAFGVPAVILYGGYESPSGHRYDGVTPFYTPVECAPCWLRSPCPHGKKCLDAISADVVEQAIRKQIGGGDQRPLKDRAGEKVAGASPPPRERQLPSKPPEGQAPALTLIDPLLFGLRDLGIRG